MKGINPEEEDDVAALINIDLINIPDFLTKLEHVLDNIQLFQLCYLC